MPYGYLSPGRGDIPAFTRAEAGTRFSDRRGMQGRVDLGNAVEVRGPCLQAAVHVACFIMRAEFQNVDHCKVILRATSHESAVCDVNSSTSLCPSARHV